MGLVPLVPAWMLLSIGSERKSVVLSVADETLRDSSVPVCVNRPLFLTVAVVVALAGILESMGINGHCSVPWRRTTWPLTQSPRTWEAGWRPTPAISGTSKCPRYCCQVRETHAHTMHIIIITHHRTQTQILSKSFFCPSHPCRQIGVLITRWRAVPACIHSFFKTFHSPGCATKSFSPFSWLFTPLVVSESTGFCFFLLMSLK